MKKLLLLSLCLSAASALAYADPIITVTPWLAPNFYGSPSFEPAAQNAIYAQMHGLTSYGTPGPTQYNANSNITPSQAIVTGFNSWMGVANPSDPALAGELGNRMTFALSILGNGSKFSISQLAFSATSTDPGNELAFAYPDGYDYSPDYVGVQVGMDGILGTKDDILIIGGSDNQLVDALYSRGSGNSFEPADQTGCAGCTTAQKQAEIDATAAFPSTYKFTGTYSLIDRNSTNGTTIASGSGTFNVAPTPEPSSLALLGTGVAGLMGLARRRFRKA